MIADFRFLIANLDKDAILQRQANRQSAIGNRQSRML